MGIDGMCESAQINVPCTRCGEEGGNVAAGRGGQEERRGGKEGVSEGRKAWAAWQAGYKDVFPKLNKLLQSGLPERVAT